MNVKTDPLEVGASLPADRLIIQANYLAQLAAREEASLGAHGWPLRRNLELLARVASLKEGLRLLGRDVVVPQALENHSVVEQAREWGQRLIYYLRNAFDDAHPQLAQLRPPPRGWQVHETLAWVEPLVRLARAHEMELSEWGGGTLFALEGEEVLEQLRQRRGGGLNVSLSASEEQLLRQKVEVYNLLCKLVRCGRALWAADPMAAQQYHVLFLRPNAAIPPELAGPGLGLTATFQLEDLQAEAVPASLAELDGDFMPETLAHHSVEPFGFQEVPRLTQDWHRDRAVETESPLAAGSVMAEREQTATADRGMAVGTEWDVYKEPTARGPEKMQPTPGKGETTPPGKVAGPPRGGLPGSGR